MKFGSSSHKEQHPYAPKAVFFYTFKIVNCQITPFSFNSANTFSS